MNSQFNETALDHLKTWMLKRETVRLRKERGLPAPWTNDKVLQNYKFCNVRREDDRISRWLIDNIANNEELDLNEKILNMFCGRMYNNLKTLEEWFPMKNPTEELFDLMDVELTDTTYLCNAYMPVNHQYAAGFFATKEGVCNGKTPSGKPALYRPSNLARMFTELLAMGVPSDLRHGYLREADVYDFLRTLPTMGEFMAYQHFVDLTYIKDLDLSEDEMVVSGPGCTMGLQCLFATELNDSYRNANNTPNLKFKTNVDNFDPEKLLYLMRESFYDWFPEWTPTLMCLENCMCEFHKYLKVIMGWGTPRHTYDGKVQTPSLFG